MKEKIGLFSILMLLGISIFLPGINTVIALDNTSLEPNTLNNGDTAFDHIYGAAGHIALAIDEEENLIFTNIAEGLAFIQRDDLTNITIYS